MCKPSYSSLNMLLINHETFVVCGIRSSCISYIHSSLRLYPFFRLSLPPGGQDVHDAQDAEEPRLGLSSPAPAPAEARRGETNRCSDLEDMSLFARGSACGPPLTQPCFDFGRCSTTNTSTFGFYVHDANCCESLDQSTYVYKYLCT